MSHVAAPQLELRGSEARSGPRSGAERSCAIRQRARARAPACSRIADPLRARVRVQAASLCSLSVSYSYQICRLPGLPGAGALAGRAISRPGVPWCRRRLAGPRPRPGQPGAWGVPRSPLAHAARRTPYAVSPFAVRRGHRSREPRGARPRHAPASPCALPSSGGSGGLGWEAGLGPPWPVTRASTAHGPRSGIWCAGACDAPPSGDGDGRDGRDAGDTRDAARRRCGRDGR